MTALVIALTAAALIGLWAADRMRERDEVVDPAWVRFRRTMAQTVRAARAEELEDRSGSSERASGAFASAGTGPERERFGGAPPPAPRSRRTRHTAQMAGRAGTSTEKSDPRSAPLGGRPDGGLSEMERTRWVS